LTLGCVTVVGLVLRLRGLSESLYGDEIFTFEITTDSGLGTVLDGVRSDLEITPPLYFVAAWLTQHLGDPMVWLRAPALVAGVATIPLVYLLGARTVGRRAAVLGASFFALSPLATYYATEARAYSVATLFVVLSGLALLRAVESDGWRWWGGFALATAAAMYSHYTSIFVLLAQAAWVALCHRRDLGRMLLSALVGAVVFVPWVPSMLDDRHAIGVTVMAQLARFTRANVIDELGRLSGGGPYAPLSSLPGPAGLWLLGGAFALGIAGLIVRVATRRPPARQRERTVLVVLWALAAPVGAALYSFLGSDLFLARNLITSLPALALVFAALLTRLPRSASAVGVAMALIGFGLGAVATFSRDTHRPAYAAAADYIEQRAKTGDVVLEVQLGKGPPGRAFEAHLDDELPLFRFVEQDEAVRRAEETGGRIFFLRPSREDALQPTAVVERMDERERRTWDGIVPLEVVVYERPDVAAQDEAWRVVFDGQSLNNLPDPPRNFPSLLLDALDVPGDNVAVNQLSWTALSRTADQRLFPEAEGPGRTVLVMTGGQADLTGDGDTGRELYDQEVEYANAARAAGFDAVVITTMPPASFVFSSDQRAARLEHNRLLLEDPEGAFDAVVDVAGDPRMSDPTGPSYTDGLHPSTSGAAVIAELLEPVLASIVRQP
jgi:hypothetical protein